MDELGALVGPMRPIEAFPTVDELNELADKLGARHPERVIISEIGRSRGGDAIRSVRVGSGERQIIVIGNPHPNEPIGMATIAHLLDRMAEDEARTLGATWHFVLCADPDGTRLNEGWFAGPLTRGRVARGYYRPPAGEQPEWSFPTTWRGRAVGTPLPETEALMDLIDRTRPAFIASLHNADFGGGFFYTSGGDETYWSALTDLLIAHDLPVHDGAADAPGAALWQRGVFAVPTFATMADAQVAAGVPEDAAAVGGGGIRDYAARYGAAVLVCELPLWIDPRVDDATPSGRTLREVLSECAAGYREVAATGAAVLERIADRLTGASPFERAATALVAALPEIARTKEAAADQDRIATRAEEFTEEYVWLGVFRLRLGGMLMRLLDEVAGPAAVAAERARFGAIFEKWCADVEADAPGRAVPREQLVAIQASAIATAVTRLRAGLPL
ncbi:M14 family zinc carboxypeptidase [Nocardia sp. NPDC052566]|uniref:M14 family zinc carboxypeptidase n=1 Tax=Nocardia sp. NPDC052566 TaxID=3364330 RepID=UPI0037C9EF46